MEKRRFGRTGLEVSVLGFGGGPIGFLQTDQDRIGSLLDELLDHGVNVIDTAAMYAGSEEAIGRAVGERRDEYILISKCGTPLEEIDAEPFSPTLIRKTVDRALKRLRTEWLDVMLLHSCDLPTLRRGDALAELLRARDAGKVRLAGYSGDNEPAAFAAELEEVTVIETSVNLCDQANIDLVLPKAGLHDVGVIAKRPLANSAWKDLAEQRGLYREYARTYSQRLAQMAITPEELGFPGEPDRRWPEIALRFAISQPGVHTAIAGTTSLEHARANLAAVGEGPLPDEAIEKLRAAFRCAESDSGRMWGGQT